MTTPPVPSRVPETRPTPLREAFIPLSLVVLVCGLVAISALELGAPLEAPFVRIALLVGGAVFLLVGADALVRVWRAAWAWLPVDRGRGLARFAWAAVICLGLCTSLAAIWLAVAAGG